MDKLQKLFNKLKYRFLIFLAVLGPGIITAVADNDAGGVGVGGAQDAAALEEADGGGDAVGG